jgi:hypothetical protein
MPQAFHDSINANRRRNPAAYWAVSQRLTLGRALLRFLSAEVASAS